MMPNPESVRREAARVCRRIVTAAAEAALFQPNGPGACYPGRPFRSSPAMRLLCPANHTMPHTSQNSEEVSTEYQTTLTPSGR